MHSQRVAGTSRRGRAGAGAAGLALVAAATLAGAGHAQAAAGPSAAGAISTVAGGVGGPAPATNVSLVSACGVAYAAGKVYVADGGSVRAVNTGTDRLSTPAGTGVRGPIGGGGPATSAFLFSACGAAADRSGNLAVADSGHQRVRVAAASTGTFYGLAMTAADIYTVAGDGHAGFSGDGAPAFRARLNDPASVTADGAGNLVIADRENNRVRVVAGTSGTFYGQSMTEGDIYTVAGDGMPGFSGDAGPAVKAKLSGPSDVAVDGAGNLVIADMGNNRVRVVAAGPGTFYGIAMTAGDIYTVAGIGIAGFSGDGGPAAGAEFDVAAGVAVDGSGNLVIADAGNRRVRVVAASSGTFYGIAMAAGDIYTVAGNGHGSFSGNGGLSVAAEIGRPQGVAADSAGNLLLAATNDKRVLLAAAVKGTLYGQPVIAGHLYSVAGNGTPGYSGDGGPAGDARLRFPQGVAFGAAGNLVIADTFNARIRLVAASTGTFYGQAMTAGDIYTVAGDGTFGFTGDGGPARGAELDTPAGVSADAAGDLLIADTLNHRVRVVAASSGTFYGQPMTAGDIYTVAGDGTAGFSGDGGPAAAAALNRPDGLAADAAGNLVIADDENETVRVVAASSGTFYGRAMIAGDIYTVAGDGSAGFSGDGGPAAAATLDSPDGLAVDGTGNLVIADRNNERVRVVAASSGTFYGRAMIAGDIYTVAGDGIPGFAGDGGPAASAELHNPDGVAVSAAGNLVIADANSERIREVTG